MRMKKILALTLATTLAVGMLAGCGGKKDSDKDSGNGNGTTTEGENGGQTSDAGTGESGEAVATKDYFPLDEKKNLSIWYYFDNSYVEDPNDLYAIRWLEEQTNVHVNFTTVTPAEQAEKFGLMLASGDYPDILRSCNTLYPGGFEKAVEEGVAVELTDLIPKHMPNYQALRTSDPILEKDTKTDSGRLVSIWSIASDNMTPKGEMMWTGLGVRKDWLDELGMGLPVTIEDWDKTLHAFKENYKCEAPLMLAKDGVNTAGHFLTAYGVYPEFYQEDGTVNYGPMQDGYKQYLELMAGWYKDGLVDPNFVTNNGDLASPNEYMGTGRAGAGGMIWNFMADYYLQNGYTDDEDFYLQAVPSPVLNAGETAGNAFAASNVAKEAHIITTNCEDVELALRWMNMWYEEDVMETMSYGKEGETYVKNEDGSYSFTDTVLNNPDYTPMDTLKALYTPGTSNMGLFNWAYYEPLYQGSESYQAEYEWAKDNQNALISSSVSMTDEESAEYTTLYTDIKTRVDEMTVKYIMGTESLDSFDSFRDSLKTYGMDRCIELWQAALDRYNER